MRVFRDLEIVEQLGSGVPRILERYGRNTFEIRPNFVRVIFWYEGSPKSSPKTAELILELIKNDPSISTEAMGAQLGISKRAVIKQTNKLKEEGLLRRVGAAKGGYWEVV